LGLALAVKALTITMIKAAFRTLLMSAAGRTPLATASKLLARGAAIELTAVAVRADEEESAAIRSFANPLTKAGL
jgi:hypothetical protein